MRMDASEEKLMNDEYAWLFLDGSIPEHTVGEEDTGDAGWNRSFDLLATKFVDESILHIASMVNMNREQEYSQVVLIGDGTCTRFCRLPWAQGTVIFLVAPAEVHERAEAILKARDENIVAPRGCMLRRVDFDLCADANSSSGAPSAVDLVAALESKGFRGSKLSVFGLQGLRAMGLSQEAFDRLFSGIADAAAFESIVLGEIKAGSAQEMDQFVAGYGMQGSNVTMEAVRDKCMPADMLRGVNPCWLTALDGDHDGRGWRLFRATQRRLSLDEMQTLALHSAAAEEADEDFFGNFS